VKNLLEKHVVFSIENWLEDNNAADKMQIIRRDQNDFYTT
jgi:hypothetical protein